MALEGVRFVPYKETLDLLSVEQAMQVSLRRGRRFRPVRGAGAN